MKTPEEKRIYVAVAGSIDTVKGKIIQPPGRQVAQACHAASKVRMNILLADKQAIAVGDAMTGPITTIILQARDSKELGHIYRLLHRRKLNPVIFQDNNPEYGPGYWPTAVAVYATEKLVTWILGYLPLWGAK
jgi:peptidyl-tRNA hydrolase